MKADDITDEIAFEKAVEELLPSLDQEHLRGAFDAGMLHAISCFVKNADGLSLGGLGDNDAFAEASEKYEWRKMLGGDDMLQMKCFFLKGVSHALSEHLLALRIILGKRTDS